MKFTEDSSEERVKKMVESEIFNTLSCGKSLSEYTKLNQTLSGVFPPDKWEREIEDYFTSDEDIRK